MARPIDFRYLGATVVGSIAVGLALKYQFHSDNWELAGFVTGVVCVYLAAIEHILNWPIGIVNVLIYAWVFNSAKLPADTSLQFFYLALSVQGWVQWAKLDKRAVETPVQFGEEVQPSMGQAISRIKPIWWTGLTLILILGTAVYYPLVVHFKGASPFFDSVLTVASIEAQVLLNWKKLENWLIWIVVDGIYIPLYITRNLVPTAILYFIFLILAILGLRNWRKRLRPSSAPLA